MALISACINEYCNELDAKGQHVIYNINLESNGNKWLVKRRYNEFNDIASLLKNNYGNIPALPGKTLFKITKPEDIEKRK